ncbi:MAG: transketolase [Proteobacteria bacterium]|nr:transketolase [Pseudomonadota bacterium]
MAFDHYTIDDLCINTIRTLSIDAIEKANSGHPGAPMGLAAAAYTLWTRILKHNPKNPLWHDRDRFVLSGGHASMLLYSLLYLTGYDLSLDDIKKFRQWESRTPGHPEFGHTPGVETTTGPLGQGMANAVGMALAERHLASKYNRPGYQIVDHFTYVMCGDGDMMEGVCHEAVSLAGHLGLSKLICIYDDNQISIEGKTDIAFTEDVAKRFEALNWHTIKVEDGNDINAISTALSDAQKESGKPSLILVKTQIAFGSPNKQGSSDAHGAPLGEEEVRLTKRNLCWPEDKSFYVPDDALKHFRHCIEKGMANESLWRETYHSFSKEYPELAMEWSHQMNGLLTNGWDKDIPVFSPADSPIATRAASGKVLTAIAKNLPSLIGGSADLAPSNKTYLNFSHDFQKDSYDGRNIRFGVREHAMGSIMTGMYLHKGLKPYGGTFLVFADYMRGAIRVASLMKLPLIYVFTHDSIAVGEDGPTHQPIEHLISLRCIPGLTVIRPCDAIETAEAWKHAVEKKDGPTALILSRQKLPILARHGAKNALGKGAYIMEDADGTPDLILIASGSEVHIAVLSKALLSKENISVRVVSMPSWELFEKTSSEYQQSILLPDVKARMAIEAGSPMGWEKYTGDSGLIIGINRFGASAPGGTNLKNFGFTAENIADQARKLLKNSGLKIAI